MTLLNNVLEEIRRYENAKKMIEVCLNWEGENLLLPGEGGSLCGFKKEKAEFAAAFLARAEREFVKEHKEEIKERAIKKIKEELHEIKIWSFAQ